MDQLSKEFEEGLAAWTTFVERGRLWNVEGEPKNPYQEGSAKYVEWESGWDEGLMGWEANQTVD
jgi:hypothetical protein